MNLAEVVREILFKKGRYEIDTVLGGQLVPLLEFTFDADDEVAGRRLAQLNVVPELSESLRGPVLSALVRAGARHPGLRDEDLARLHLAARDHGHIELFVDINALNQGLVAQIARSLGGRLARIVLSSSTMDVLHEYQSLARRHHNGGAQVVAAWELARAMRSLGEFKVPVHVHQLAPGAARYFRRGRADGTEEAKNAPSKEQREEPTYIAEDRQMIAALWDYVATVTPRIPLFLVTADLALAHVCAAERVPFLFGRAPRESPTALATTTLWFDPYALAFRSCLAQVVLWELSLVFGTINVRFPLDTTDQGQNFSLNYQPREHLPGQPEDVRRDKLAVPTAPSDTSVPRATQPRPSAATPTSDRKLKLALGSLVEVLPTHQEQQVPLTLFKLKDADSMRQLWQIGEATELFAADASGKSVIAGRSLPLLLQALLASDYLAVNAVFRKVPGYERVIRDAEETGAFPSSKDAGAATGWAISLGAAYKMLGATRFGLREVTDEQFERSVVRAHADVAGGERSVLLYRVLDRVCSEMGLSPIRFEASLNRCLGQRGLRDFEAQRATSNGNIPAHHVLVLPTSSASSSYLRRLVPGEGVIVGSKLVGALVRRGSGT
jgi:hypothetical protein